ncbi:MAG TPA: head maturation protease, ClpP-related [Chthoniobacteraceae bacterium]|jgi:ATP-dependent Clp endopeptidase proteolytic subunit ClpP|nr:head maturation protease, ClpP-related [Chthoniobacteraceae bacterium]
MSEPAQSWYRIRNAAADSVEIAILDEIGAYGVGSKAFNAELKKHTGKRVLLRLNSPGGSVVEGNAIANALRRHKGGITVQIDALCASMATLLSTCGAPVKMAENGLFMIHNPSANYVSGDAGDLRKTADLLDKMKGTLVAAYVAKTGKPAAEIQQAMDDVTWLSADEAKEWGFVDEITDRVTDPKAFFDLTKLFANAPAVDMPGEASANAHTTASQMDLAALTAQVAQLTSQFTAETAKVTDLTARLTAETAKATALEADKLDLTNKLTAETAKVADLTGKLSIETGKVTALESEKAGLVTAKAKADGKLERLARNGITAEKDAPEILDANKADPVALWESYQAADPIAKAEMRAKHGDKLDAAAVAWDAAQSAAR